LRSLLAVRYSQDIDFAGSKSYSQTALLAESIIA